jgi:hypothetical protein
VTNIRIGNTICRPIEKLWLVYGKFQKGACSRPPSDSPRSGTQSVILGLSQFWCGSRRPDVNDVQRLHLSRHSAVDGTALRHR